MAGSSSEGWRSAGGGAGSGVPLPSHRVGSEGGLSVSSLRGRSELFGVVGSRGHRCKGRRYRRPMGVCRDQDFVPGRLGSVSRSLAAAWERNPNTEADRLACGHKSQPCKPPRPTGASREARGELPPARLPAPSAAREGRRGRGAGACDILSSNRIATTHLNMHYSHLC